MNILVYFGYWHIKLYEGMEIMKAVAKKTIYILSVIIIILNFQGCTSSKPNDLEVEVIIDKMDNTDVVASLFYENHVDKMIKGYRTYLWKDKKIIKSNKKFLPLLGASRSSTYPEKSLKKLENQIKLNGISNSLDKPFAFYGNTTEYELFIFKGYDRDEWILYFLMDKNVESITISMDEIEHISDCELTNDTVYIYSNAIYEINMTDFSLNKLEIEKKEPFEFNPNRTIIKNGTIYTVSLDSDMTLFYKYNFDTGGSEVSSSVDNQIERIEKLFPYKEGFVALCTEIGTFKPLLKYYDNEFNLVDSKYIDIKSEHNDVTAYYEGHYFCLYDNKLYGKMGVDGRHIDEIVVIDVDSADLLYQAELDHKVKNIIMTDLRFHTLQNEKLININQG